MRNFARDIAKFPFHNYKCPAVGNMIAAPLVEAVCTVVLSILALCDSLGRIYMLNQLHHRSECTYIEIAYHTCHKNGDLLCCNSHSVDMRTSAAQQLSLIIL